MPSARLRRTRTGPGTHAMLSCLRQVPLSVIRIERPREMKERPSPQAPGRAAKRSSTSPCWTAPTRCAIDCASLVQSGRTDTASARRNESLVMIICRSASHEIGDELRHARVVLLHEPEQRLLSHLTIAVVAGNRHQRIGRAFLVALREYEDDMLTEPRLADVPVQRHDVRETGVPLSRPEHGLATHLDPLALVARPREQASRAILPV